MNKIDDWILNYLEEKKIGKRCLLCKDSNNKLKMFPFEWFKSLELDLEIHKDSLSMMNYQGNYIFFCHSCWRECEEIYDNHLTDFINSKLSKD